MSHVILRTLKSVAGQEEYEEEETAGFRSQDSESRRTRHDETLGTCASDGLWTIDEVGNCLW
jgi:hypothetical protein